MEKDKREHWDSGDAYEQYMGRWSRPIARHFLDWLAQPANSRWLDVGCGTGALTQSILTYANPQIVIGIDPSQDFIAHARQAITDERARFEVGSGSDIPVEPASVDVVVSGLALNFMPDIPAALTAMRQTVVPDGTVAAYVWDYAGKMEWLRLFWDACITHDSAALEADEGRRFPICQPEPLRQAATSAGLKSVVVEPIDMTTTFHDFDDYWTPFLSGQFPAPQYLRSVSEDTRIAIRETLRERLPIAADGSIDLIARVWAVRGQS